MCCAVFAMVGMRTGSAEAQVDTTASSAASAVTIQEPPGVAAADVILPCVDSGGALYATCQALLDGGMSCASDVCDQVFALLESDISCTKTVPCAKVFEIIDQVMAMGAACPVGGGPVDGACANRVLAFVKTLVGAPACPIGGGALDVDCVWGTLLNEVIGRIDGVCPSLRCADPQPWIDSVSTIVGQLGPGVQADCLPLEPKTFGCYEGNPLAAEGGTGETMLPGESQVTTADTAVNIALADPARGYNNLVGVASLATGNIVDGSGVYVQSGESRLYLDPKVAAEDLQPMELLARSPIMEGGAFALSAGMTPELERAASESAGVVNMLLVVETPGAMFMQSLTRVLGDDGGRLAFLAGPMRAPGAYTIPMTEDVAGVQLTGARSAGADTSDAVGQAGGCATRHDKDLADRWVDVGDLHGTGGGHMNVRFRLGTKSSSSTTVGVVTSKDGQTGRLPARPV